MERQVKDPIERFNELNPSFDYGKTITETNVLYKKRLVHRITYYSDHIKSDNIDYTVGRNST